VECASLQADALTLSAYAGGRINFTLSAGPEFGYKTYFLCASASGTSPGITLPNGAVLPLNRDMVFNYIQNNISDPMFEDFMGALDMDGQATASLDSMGSLPPILPPGTIINFAYTTMFPFDFQSNTVAVEIVP